MGLVREKEDKCMFEKRTYKKSNSLICGMTQSSLLENKILAMGMAKAVLKEGRMIAKISASEIVNALSDLKQSSGSTYSQIKNAAFELTSRKVFIEDINKNAFSVINLIGSTTYLNGELTIKFEPDLTDYLLDLKTNYTTFSIPILMSIENVRAYRLYEILKSKAYGSNTYGDRYIVSFGISELKLLLGMIDTNAESVSKALKRPHPDFDYIVNIVSKDNNYNATADFRRRILAPAVKEINQKTDLEVDFKFGKEGHGKATRVIFSFKKKDLQGSNVDVELTEDEIMDMIDVLIASFDEPLKVKDAKALLSASNYNVNTIIDCYELASKQKNIDNLIGWMLTALKKEYYKD